MTNPGSLGGQVPDGEDFVIRRLQDMQRQINELRAANPLNAASVPSGGSVVIQGGSLTMVDTTGTTLFSVGPQQYGDNGVTAYRSDGTVVFRIAKIFGPSDTQQAFLIYDRAGRVVGGDAQLSPTGFDSPHVPLTWRPIDRSDAKSTTSTSFVSLFQSRGIHNNPGVPFSFAVVCSDSTTAGQIQVIDKSTGTGLAAFFASPWVGTIPAGTTTETIITSPSLGIPGGANDSFIIEVQVKRTAGTGSISVSMAQSVGGGF